MGNIISNSSSPANTINGQLGTENAFEQIMTDILLELNLFNEGNYNEKTDLVKTTSSQITGPRDEFNFSDSLNATNNVVTLNSTGTTSNDIQGKGRPTIGGKYVDIAGIKYVTNEYNDETWSSNNWSSSNSKTSYRSGAYSKGYANKYYNIKRAVCNASTNAPIDIVGVDIPADDPDIAGLVDPITGVTGDNFSSTNLITSQKTYYPSGTTNMSTIVNNCVTYGTKTGPSALADSSIPIMATLVSLNLYYGINRFDGNNLWASSAMSILRGFDTVVSRNIKTTIMNPNLDILMPTTISVQPGYTAYVYKNPGTGNMILNATSFTGLSKPFNILRIMYIVIAKTSLGLPPESIVNPERNSPTIYYNGDFQDNIATITSASTSPSASTTLYSLTMPNIPDLTPTSPLILNDYSMVTLRSPSSSSGFSPHTIYDTPITDPDCISILDNLIINSYVNADITKYSKWPTTVKNQNITTSTIANYAFVHDPVSGMIDLATFDPVQGRETINRPFNPETNTNLTLTSYPATAMVYAQAKSVSTSTSNQTDMNDNCQNFESDLCQWYYYYDIVDGLNYNPTSPITVESSTKYIPNIQYLSKHIPDCRCQSIVTLNSSTQYTDPAYINFYGAGCLNNQFYSPYTIYANGQNNNYTNIKFPASASGSLPLYNVNKPTSTTNYGYRRQFDPISVVNTSRFDNMYAYVGGGLRSQARTVNNYTCNMSFTPEVGNVGGNVVIGNVNMSCNMGGGGGAAPPPSPPSGSAGSGSAGSGSSGSSSSCTTLCPTITNIKLLNPTQTTPTYNIPLETTSSLVPTNSSVNVEMNVNSALNSAFLTNYQFLFVLTSNPDPTKGTLCSYIGSSCGSAAGACSPYTVTIPFIFGTSYGINQYTLMIRNKPGNTSNPINPTSYNIPLKLQTYFITISSTNLTSVSGNLLMAVEINLNTSATIPILQVRIVLTPKTGSSPVVSQSYDNLQTALNSNVITVGSGSGQTILPIIYNYIVMVNEKVETSGTGVKTYSGGYQLPYDQSMSIASQGTADFTNIVSRFNSIAFQYMDYNNDNSLLYIQPNDTLLIGSTLLYKWVFTSLDVAITSIKVYYDTNANYVPSSTTSATSVLLKSTTLGTLNTATNTYSNQINFICPFISTTGPVIFYAVGVGAANNIYSATITVTLPQISTSSNVKNWVIIPNNTSPDMTTLPSTSLTPVLETGQTISSINSYFTAGKNGNFKYIIYNPSNISWYGSNATPVAVSSSSSTTPSYTIFQNPYNLTPAPSIVISNIVSTVGTERTFYSSSTTGSITLELGAELKLNYQITNITNNTNIQLIIANKTALTFPFRTGAPSTGSVTFTVFGDLTVANPTLVLSSYGIWSSTPIPIVLNNDGATRKTLSAASATPASSVTFTSQANPAINITASNDTIILNLASSYGVMNENQYITQLSGFSSPLSVRNTILTFGTMNFSLPFSYIFHSSLIQGFTNNHEPFTNARQLYLESKKPKKNSLLKEKTSINSNIIESFIEHATTSTNIVTFDKLTFDFSSSTLDTLNNIQLMFSGYTSVTITNLVLVFGTLALDNKKFNINIFNNATSTTVLNIPNVTIIGTLSSNIFILSTIPGLRTVKYSVSRMINNDYALIVPLTVGSSIGKYTLPSTYQSQLTTILNPATSGTTAPNPVRPPLITQAPSTSTDFLSGLQLSTGLSATVIMGIAGVIILIILYLVYTTFIKK
jgi:hypothetical protein